MIPYITYREKDEKGELLYFILQKEFPHYKAVISDKPVSVLIEPIPITDYNLFLVFAGTLRGFMIPSYNNVDKDISTIMANMAEWFYNERILINDKKYKKWKINDSGNTK